MLRGVASSSGGGGITIGTTTITGGATTEVLYNLGGVVQSTSKLIINAAAGQGPSIVAGTATTDVAAFSLTRTNNNAAVATGVLWTFTDTSSAAGFLPFQIIGGAAGATNILSLTKLGAIAAGAPNDNGLYIGFPAGGTSGYTYLGASNSGALTTGNAVWFSNGATTWTQGTTLNIQEAAINLRPSGSIVGSFASTGYSHTASGKLLLGVTAPTIASGGCTSPTVTDTNGTAYFTIDVGTSCSGSQPVVFTMPAATTGWKCTARNVTNGAGSAPAQTGAISTTSVTITNFSRTLGTAAAWTDADDVTISCLGG